MVIGEDIVDILKIVSQYVWIILTAFWAMIWRSFKKIENKVDNTYTKEETLQMIDLKIIPLIEGLERNSSLIEKQTKVLEKLNDNIQLLHVDMSAIKVKVEDIEKYKS